MNLIFGGHTHTILSAPSQVGNVSIFQAGQYGRFLGNLLLRCYADGSHKVLSYDLVEIDKQKTEDEEIRRVIDQMQAERNARFAHPIAQLPAPLDGERDSIRNGRSTLAPLITQALFEQAVSFGYQPDGAVINGFGIRTSLSAGPVYYSDVVKVLPFSKRVLLVSIRGEDLISSLTTGLHPQVHGIQRRGNRFCINGRAVEPAKNYQIVTNSFVWSGKDNYDEFHKATIIRDLGLDVDILSNFLEEKFGN